MNSKPYAYIYSFYFGDQFIKNMILHNKRAANKECRNLELDYKLKIYSVSCKIKKEIKV